MINFVYVVYSETDYEGCGSPAGVYSTYDAALKQAMSMIKPGSKIAEDIHNGIWTFYHTLSAYSVNIERFKVSE